MNSIFPEKLNGSNWGELKLEDKEIVFDDEGFPLFSFPYSKISNSTALNKNEIILDFNQDDNGDTYSVLLFRDFITNIRIQAPEITENVNPTNNPERSWRRREPSNSGRHDNFSNPNKDRARRILRGYHCNYSRSPLCCSQVKGNCNSEENTRLTFSRTSSTCMDPPTIIGLILSPLAGLFFYLSLMMFKWPSL